VETCTAALDKLKTGEQARVSPFFVSIDVDRDNAEKLAGYMHEHEMAGSWKALLDKNLTASRAFGARREVTRAKDGEISIRHTTTIYLIDRNMRIRAAFDPEEGADEISQRIEKELRNG
jgi:cytochrome oxidase Cu insertion factor (SCO1/SenC/PrrC family)